MKKIEIIWREILYQALEKQNRQFTQKGLAAKFGFSTSTVFQALKIPRKMGAVRVTGRFFVLSDPEKLLYYWATFRNLQKDLLWEARIELPVAEIEGQIPAEVVYAVYTAARKFLKIPAADYNHIFVYAKTGEAIKKRFAQATGKTWPNLTVLKADSYLQNYGSTTTLAQTFVDLWNLSEWQAKEYIKTLQEKINGLLS